MKILLTTEGTYPSIVGGVSNWCDQLVRGLNEVEFHLLQVVGPLPTKPAYSLPVNVTNLTTVHLWSRESGRGRSASVERRVFNDSLAEFLRFGDSDLDAFSSGLLRLGLLSSRAGLWDLFDHPTVWELVSETMERLQGQAPRLAEVGLAVSWLKQTLGPLLIVPPPADQAHTTSNGLSAIPAWLASMVHGIPLMLTEHGLYLRERYLSLSGEENPPALKLLRARFYRTLAQLIYRDADLIVSVSEFNRVWQIELGALPEHTRVVYNGVEPQAFPLPGDDLEREPTVAWVGRIDPVKDLETLVQALLHVRREVPAARLRLFGPVPRGNEAYGLRVRHLVNKLGLNGPITFEGPVSPIHRAYHAGDVIVLSSVSEGFPYAAIEAMMCGRPVVATHVGGISEAVGAFGRLVAPRDPERLGHALAELLSNVPLRKELGAGARERALSLFTLSRMYAGYRSLYRELSNASPLEVSA